LKNQWLALTDLGSDKPEQIRGNLRMSMNILGPGDEGVELVPPTNPLKDPEDVMMPPHLSPWTKQLEVMIWKGNVCATGDTEGMLGGKSDPLLRVSFNGVSLKTSIKDNEENPNWCETLYFV